MQYSRKSTSISLNEEIWKISKLLASQISAQRGGYCQPVDIVERSLLETLKEFKYLLPKEYHQRIDSINLPNRLPKLK